MMLRTFIVLLPLLWWAFDLKAQLPQEVSQAPQQWQLTLDVIKSRAQSAMVENNGLQVEYRQLLEQVQKLQKAITDQQNKNEQMELSLKGRLGGAQQKARIAQLRSDIKAKKQQLGRLDAELEQFNRNKTVLDQKIQQLKYGISAVEFHQEPLLPKEEAAWPATGAESDGQLGFLRKHLEEENRQEVLLENQLEALKRGDQQGQNLNVDEINDENKNLEARLDTLRLQKLRLVNKSPGSAAQAGGQGADYQQLLIRKNQLEADISAYAARLDSLKTSTLTKMPWPLMKKKLIHTMVQADSRNNQMRAKIKVLREDITVLKDKVARLERRLIFARGQDINQ